MQGAITRAPERSGALLFQGAVAVRRPAVHLSPVSDFIAKYGIFSGVGVALLAWAATRAVAAARRKRGYDPNRALAFQPLDVEVVPLSFQVSLTQQIPDVWVWLRVINYLNRDLTVSDVTATYCQVDRGPPLENIPGGEHRITARRSIDVRCRRTLLDAETKVFLTVPWTDEFSAHLNLRLRGTAGKKPIALDVGGFSIRGWITGLPSYPANKPAPTHS